MLVTIQASEAEALYGDASEADYVPVPVSVVLADGSLAPAVCYNLPGHKLGGTNAAYARSLLSLAAELGLPEDCVRQIRLQAQ